MKEPSPQYGHQRLVSLIHVALAALAGPERALTPPSDVVLGEHDVYQPDLLVLREVPAAGRDAGIPLLVVEVLSASTARRDRGVKRRRLLGAGVDEVWLVDPASRQIECHARGAVLRATGDTRVASTALPGFALTPNALF